MNMRNAKERTPPMASTPPDHDRERLIAVLQHELDAARAREQAYATSLGRLVERLHERVEAVELQLRQIQRASEEAAAPYDPHGMRERICAVLQKHPQGLSRKAIEQAVESTKNLSDTLVGMARPGGSLFRPRPGVFALLPA